MASSMPWISTEDIGLKIDILLEDADMRLEMEVRDVRPVEEDGEAERGVDISELEEEYG
jgi:hypothetical protein